MDTWSRWGIVDDDYTNVSTATGLSDDEIERNQRDYKKHQLKQIIDGDDILIQEVITELRKKKIESIKNGKRKN